jgi:hypothetical protein
MFFAPPLFFVLLSMPFLHAKQIEVFAFIETKEVRADPSLAAGHVAGPCHFMRHGWLRCFFISILLCFLGWIPAVIFNIGIAIHYFKCMCRNGW